MNNTQLCVGFSRLRALVAGDAILDRFLTGTPRELCREQPVPVIVKTGEVRRAGGAANAAANLRSLGARVRFVSLTGADRAGKQLREELRAAGVSLKWMPVVAGARSAHKIRILADGHYLARIDEEAAGFESASAQSALMSALSTCEPAFDVALISDYGGGCISTQLFERVAALCEERGCPLVIDAKDILRYRHVARCVLTPNLAEACRAADLPLEGRALDLSELAARLRTRLAAQAIVVTMGTDGVLLVHGKTLRTIEARRVAVKSSVGAGDSFAAALALALVKNGLESAASIALEAAAVAVAKPYTATVSLPELRERLDLLSTPEEPASGDDLSELLPQLAQRRAAGERIVLTNGVFDLIHDGHISLLECAKALGDVLVVAINSDAGARALKGIDRPINNLRHRRNVVQALKCVDYVVSFEGLTAEDVVERVRPHVYVHGNDRPADQIPEAACAFALGAQVVFLPHATPTSTSRIIERVTARSHSWAASDQRPAFHQTPSTETL